jgi:hypothetical protein
VVAPGQMPGNFLPSPDADCLHFKLCLYRENLRYRHYYYTLLIDFYLYQ